MKLLVVVLLGVLLGRAQSSRVLELSDRFVELKKDGHWLVMFYAPWCGHCKRLEPVWGHVAQALTQTHVRVARVDCTRYTRVATHFNVHAFPTIMYVRGEDVGIVFRGDRTKDELVHFALRLSGPPVQPITKATSLALVQESKPTFFLYLGPTSGPLWEVYYDAAVRFQPFCYFYASRLDILRGKVNIETEPGVVVFKEKTHYVFPGAPEHELNASLSHWVNGERFDTFAKVTKSNLHQLMATNKFLVLAVVQENKLEELPEDMIIFRDMVQSVIVQHRDKYHRVFQFGWLGSPELASSIAMMEVPVPYLLVVNSTTSHHHLPEFEVTSSLSAALLEEWLMAVAGGGVATHGGTGLPVRAYRALFEARAALRDMWRGNPVLTAVLLGLPAGFLALILYSICCADIMDMPEDDPPEYSHEKKE